MYALEGRVDYMGSSILMTRLSDMTLTLRDEWKIDKVQDADAPLATTRSVSEGLKFCLRVVRWFFSGISRFRPTFRLTWLKMSEIILTGCKIQIKIKKSEGLDRFNIEWKHHISAYEKLIDDLLDL